MAAVTGYGRRWIAEIVRRYNAEGAGGLGDQRARNTGARPLLSQEDEAALREALAEPPTDGGLAHAHQADQGDGPVGPGPLGPFQRFRPLHQRHDAYTMRRRGATRGAREESPVSAEPQIEAFLEMMAVERAASVHTLTAYGRDVDKAGMRASTRPPGT